MGYKSVSLTAEVYEMLKKNKGADESFSDVIKRLLEQPNIGELLELAGVWKDISEEEIAALRKATRGRKDDS